MKVFPLIYLLLIFCSIHIHAQTYQVTVSNEPFIFLENAEDAVHESWVIPEFDVPIGFDFEFFDLTANRFYSLPNSVGGVFELNPDTDHLYELIPFYASMIDRGYAQDSALSPIRYKTEGPEGQKVFTLELKEAGLFYGPESEDYILLDHISFQIKLYEASGDIEFHYGPYSITESPEIIFDPFPGPIVGLLADANWDADYIGETILLEGNPLYPNIVTDSVYHLDWPIPENTVYRFSRMGTSLENKEGSNSTSIIYPNPTSGTIHLNHDIAHEVQYPIVIVDITGKTIDQWDSEDDMSAEHLSAGTYYVFVQTEERVITETLVVMR